MERTKQKSKKDKPNKYVEKEKSSTFIPDVKTMKENLKIREILRTVKMNSSMRIKAPRGSKVMQNKDFNDNEDIIEDNISIECHDGGEPTSATNTILNSEMTDGNVDAEEKDVTAEERKVISDSQYVINETDLNTDSIELEFSEKDITDYVDTSVIHKSISLSVGLEDCGKDDVSKPSSPVVIISPTENAGTKSRDRKLSLDHTMLSRCEGLSQSEVDLHSIGKLPLERKSSFFRKKMDSFVRNTTEIFKRQSLSSKSTRSPITQRRGSNSSRMSVSLQSLNENPAFYEEYEDAPIDKYHEQQRSLVSLQSCATSPARSDSTVSVNVSDRPPDNSEEESLAGSQQALSSQPFPDIPSVSVHSLNEGLVQDSLLNTRAISMSSGLDTANGQRRRKTSRSNRVSWLASESLTDYFRRLIQDEKSQQIQGGNSYQDFSDIPENNLVVPRIDSKGRRLSYVRAVSGEEPALASRYQDSSLRRRKLPENEDSPRPDIEFFLDSFEKNGIPNLDAFTAYKISDEAETLLETLYTEAAIEKEFERKPGLSSAEEIRQEIVKEIVYTEAQYIRHLNVIVKIYIAAAHALQNYGVLQGLNTATLFPHIPDIYNANVKFWEKCFYPMLKEAKRTGELFDPKLMIPGFYDFAEIFDCYEDYVQCQSTAVEYLRNMHAESEFVLYLAWCNKISKNRLQLADMLAKPMQRLTKYSLLISRLSHHIDDEDKKRELELVDSNIRSFTLHVNRAVRLKEECMKVEELKIEPYEPDFKDDDTERAYKKFNKINLMVPMIDCGPYTSRCLIHHGLLRYKDHLKEFDSHILLFTDMILICKRYPKVKEREKEKDKKEYSYWKMLRPKVLLHRAVPNIKPGRTHLDPPILIYVVLDEQGCSKAVFQLSETSKDQNPVHTLKIWEAKFYEAIMTYTLTKWYYKYPVRDLIVIEREYNDDTYRKEKPELCAVEKKSRERVAAMFHAQRQPDPSRDAEILLSTIDRERGPPNLHTIFESGMKNFNAWQSRSSSFHQSTTSRSSHHRSSCELHVSMSGGSHEELHSISLQRSGSSVEQNLPPWFFDETHPSPAITVNIVPEIGCQSLMSSRLPSPPTLVLQQSSPHHSPGPRSASAGGGSENTLGVSSQNMVYSMPNINKEFLQKPDMRLVPQTASEKLYRSHQELMERNRLAAGKHHLSPDHRGSSYPPPSPTRGSLKRGLAFSYSFTSNPPLTRSQNVNSVSQAQIDVPTKFADIPRRILGRLSPQLSIGSSRQRSPSPTPTTYRDSNKPSTSRDKREKIKPLFMRRSKESTRSESSDRTRGEQSDDTDYDADDDRSRRSSKSNKGEKVKRKVESCILEDESSITGEEQDDSEESPTNAAKKRREKG